MLIQCPQCDSTHIKTLNYAKKVGTGVGTVAGITSGVLTVTSTERIGCIVCPPGATASIIAGAVIAGLAGGITGGSTGASLGKVIDDHILDNYQCLSCNCQFSQPEHSHVHPFMD